MRDGKRVKQRAEAHACADAESAEELLALGCAELAESGDGTQDSEGVILEIVPSGKARQSGEKQANACDSTVETLVHRSKLEALDVGHEVENHPAEGAAIAPNRQLANSFADSSGLGDELCAREDGTWVRRLGIRRRLDAR